MGLNIWRQGSWLVAEISGDLDIASVPLIRVRLDQTLSDQIVCGLILDLTGVSFRIAQGLVLSWGGTGIWLKEER